MGGTNKGKNREWVWKLSNIIVPIVCVILTHLLTNASTQATFVEQLSAYFDVVDKKMSYEQAIEAMYKESDKLKNENTQLEKQIADLQTQISTTPDFEFISPTLIVDGLKIEENIKNSIVALNSTNYYSQNILNMFLDKKLSYNVKKNTVFYAKSGQKISSENKVKLLDTDVLYDGVCYGVYLPSDGKTFAMGSGTYNDGFVIYDDHSLFGEGDGYALFDLKGQYSKISFDVGRTNEYEKQDVVLKVYLDDKYTEEYSLNAQSPPIPLEINLNYAKSLKLEITGGNRVKYGFTNAILHY